MLSPAETPCDAPAIRLHVPFEPLPEEPAQNFRALVERAMHPESLRALTPRQLEIGRMVGRCMSRKKIARLLGLRLVTIDAHTHKAAEVLGLDSTLELAVFFALRAVLIDAEEVLR